MIKSFSNNVLIVRETGNQYYLTSSRVIDLSNDINKYVKILKKASIKVPTYINCQPQKKSVKVIATYYPNSLLEMITRKFFNWKKVANKYLELFKKIFEFSNNSNSLKLSVDPHPSNFMINGDEFVYIDFTPPFFKESGQWREYRRLDELNQKREWKENRYLTKRGLIINWLNRFVPYYIDYKKDIFLYVTEYLSNKNMFVHPFLKYIKKPYSLNKNAVIKFVKKASPGERDKLRFIILVFTQMNLVEITKVYKKYKSPEKHEGFKHFVLRKLDTLQIKPA